MEAVMMKALEYFFAAAAGQIIQAATQAAAQAAALYLGLAAKYFHTMMETAVKAAIQDVRREKWAPSKSRQKQGGKEAGHTIEAGAEGGEGVAKAEAVDKGPVG